MEDGTKTGPPKDIKQVGEALWEIPKTFKEGMQVPARIVATKKLLQEMDGGVFDQLTNVACLPGIQKYAYCMPDGHWGYGFPIGGVAAFDTTEGVISPGGIGFDINCGMKLVRTNLTFKEVGPKVKELIDQLYNKVPVGVGCKGFVDVNKNQFKTVMEEGVKWCVDNGYAWKEDVERTEGKGKIEWADSSKVADRAVARGIDQLGTLGSGNHYLEIQVAHKENIHDKKIAKSFGIDQDEQVVIMLHCGSRGFGHEIASNYMKTFEPVMKKNNILVRDRELACAPFSSREGQDYFKAMACAANMAFANRQVIVHRIREVFSKVFDRSAEDLGMDVVYDVAHNIAKVEKHKVDGSLKELIVHRKGATRAFPPGHAELPSIYKETGQPVIIGGSMETGSYLLSGLPTGEETFFSTCHGSGRTMSRTKAKGMARGDELQKKMLSNGIYVRTSSMSGLAEEAGFAYKNLSEVIKSADIAGITKPVVQLKPIGCLKG
ncbi:MAG: RtcB family protein [Candidatus Nanoarchaeia archaeon]